MTTSIAEVPERLRVDFDVHDTALEGVVDRVNEKVAEVAARGPVVYSTAHGGHWFVTGYEEVQEVLRNSELFSAQKTSLLSSLGGRILPSEYDPPEHTAYRQALQPLFSPSRMKALESDIRVLTNRLLDGFATRGECEFVADFAHALPTSVFLKLMGWPEADEPLFNEATDIAVRGVPGGTDEENAAAIGAAALKITGYFANVVADRRSRTDVGDDITATVVNTPIQIDGETRALSDDELCRMFFLLCIAGLHTVQGTLGWSMLHLSQRPEQRQRLIDDPGLLPSAVEELLRFEAAVSTGRVAKRDTELGGVQLKAGDQLLCMLAGANRDVREFPNPAELQLDRTPNRHLSFGSGAHRCLGSHLARIEVRVALEEIHRRIPDYRLNPEKPTIWHASQVRGVVEMPLLFTPESA
ncbi:cytochrome P450 [Mycobacterium sp.]|uniref:cytochrome P450 n=1 Tax=Mycobacterium sp. TaxID=1785 RepID=UPI00120DDCED|nr:cytochrome P450 [Mycobacterium sp.]TAM69715.1 MAG: cytochrome P450 [Mycobacterium sp.]